MTPRDYLITTQGFLAQNQTAADLHADILGAMHERALVLDLDVRADIVVPEIVTVRLRYDGGAGYGEVGDVMKRVRDLTGWALDMPLLHRR